MKTGKDIFTLIREGEHKLSITPSASAWKKLETRLEANRMKGRVVWMRRLAAAAAVLVLVGSFYLWNATSGSSAMQLRSAPKPSFIEDLTGADNCQPFCLLLNSRNQLPPYYAHPFEKIN